MHCDDFTRTDADRRSRLSAPMSRRRLLQAGLGATMEDSACGYASLILPPPMPFRNISVASALFTPASHVNLKFAA